MGLTAGSLRSTASVARYDLVLGTHDKHGKENFLEIQEEIDIFLRSIGPAVTREQCPAFLRNSNGRVDLPGPTQEAA